MVEKRLDELFLQEVLSEWEVCEKKGWNVIGQGGVRVAEVKKGCHSVRLDFFCPYLQLRIDKELKKVKFKKII